MIECGDNQRKRLTRSSDDAWVAGVCGGFAQYFGWDAGIVRLVYLLLTLFTAFSGLFIYIILWVLMPKK